MTVQLGIAEAVPVDCNDAVSIFGHYITVGIHTESTDQIIILPCPVDQLSFIDFVSNVFKDLRRHLYPHAYVDLIVNKGQSQSAALFGKPFRTGTSGSSDQIITANISFILAANAQFKTITVPFDSFHMGITADLHSLSQIFINMLHNNKVIFSPQMPDLGV